MCCFALVFLWTNCPTVVLLLSKVFSVGQCLAGPPEEETQVTPEFASYWGGIAWRAPCAAGTAAWPPQLLSLVPQAKFWKHQGPQRAASLSSSREVCAGSVGLLCPAGPALLQCKPSGTLPLSQQCKCRELASVT